MVVVNNPANLHPQHKMRATTNIVHKLVINTHRDLLLPSHGHNMLKWNTALGVGVAGVAATGPISCWVWLVLVVCC